MYEAVSSNHREVEKGLTQLERSIRAAVKRNDYDSVVALSRIQALIVSVKAEARLTKIVYTPKVMTSQMRDKVLNQDSAIKKWRVAIDESFRKHYNVTESADFADVLDHDTLAKHTTLHSLLDNELVLIISLRNKLAHGQWNFPLVSNLSAVDPVTVSALKHEDTVSLRLRDRLITHLGNIVVDLVSSEKLFESRFDQYFDQIRRYQRDLASYDYDEWTRKVHAGRVTLMRVDPEDGPGSERDIPNGREN